MSYSSLKANFYVGIVLAASTSVFQTQGVGSNPTTYSNFKATQVRAHNGWKPVLENTLILL